VPPSTRWNERPRLGIPTANPPGIGEALWAIPGSLAALAASFWYGAHRDRVEGIVRR
jgi:hypothetical protein